MSKKIKRIQSLGEEIANAISHGTGTLLSVAGLVLLCIKTKKQPVQIRYTAVFALISVAVCAYSFGVHYLGNGVVYFKSSRQGQNN